MRWRSLLFVAADDGARIAKVAERGADAVILDLEDAVPPDRKPAARAALATTAPVLAAAGIAVVVRINSAWRDVHADLAHAVRADVAAIMVPKVDQAGRLATLAEMIAEWAAPCPPPALIALIESPAALPHLPAIAAVDGVIGLALGTEDFALALGVPPTNAALALPCRMLALAAAARGVMALGLPLSIATVADEAAWQSGITEARAVGMTGALCIHPRQVAPVNAGFAPAPQDLASAERTLAAWDAAGGAGAILVDGRMVDLPVVLAARRLLAAR